MEKEKKKVLLCRTNFQKGFETDIHVLKIFNGTTFLTQSQLYLDTYKSAKIFKMLLNQKVL